NRKQCRDHEHDRVRDRGPDPVGALAPRNAGRRRRGAPGGLAFAGQLRHGGDGRNGRQRLGHQATSALPKRSRWISVTVKMNRNRTTPTAAAYPNLMLPIAWL